MAMEPTSAAVTTSSSNLAFPFEAKYALFVNLSANPIFLRPNKAGNAVANEGIPLLGIGSFWIFSLDMAGQDKIEKLRSLAMISTGGSATLSVLLIG